MKTSQDSMREKLASSSDDLPYREEETEYHDVSAHTRHEEGNTGDIDELEEYESFHEYNSIHKPYRKPIYRRKRYIVGCLIATVIFLAIFIPLFLKFALPAIAQAMMNHAGMNVVQLNMTEPGETAMVVSVLASVSGIPKIFSASMEFTQTVNIVWNDILIGNMTLGTVYVKKGKGDILQTTTFQILNTTAFGDFAKVMLSADGFTWTMSSIATVKAMGQTIKNLKINKKLDMHDIKILAFDLPSDAPDGNGALVTIQAVIPNPSPIGMVLGTITLDMYFKTAYLGRVVAKNVTLVGGQDMALNLEGQLFKQTDPVHASELSLLMSNYLANIPTLATGKGVSVFPDGTHAVSWLTNAITSTSLTVPLKAVAPLDVIKNIAINDMNLVMSEANPWSPTVNSNSVSADFKIPFNISINITQLANTTFKMAYQNISFVEISTAIWNMTASDMPNNKVVFTVPPSPMNVYDQSAFSDFLMAMTQKDQASIEIMGSAQGIAVTSLGTVQLTVPLSTTLSLKGINLASQHPTVSDILVVGGTTSQVAITGNVGLNNPSIFSVTLGPIVLQLKCIVNGTEGYVGTASIANLVLKPGMNVVPSSIAFEPTDKNFGNQFLGSFVAGASFKTSVFGDENTSRIASILPTLKSLIMSTTLPGMIPAPQLLKGGNSSPTLGQILGPRLLPLQVTAANPLATVIWIETMTASVFWEGNYFGGVDHAHIPFAVSPNITTVSPVVQLQCPLGYDFALFLITQFIPKNLAVLTGGTVDVDMESELEVIIGGPLGTGYDTTIQYSQSGVPAFLKVDYTFAGMTKRSFASEERISPLYPAASSDQLAVLPPSERRAVLARMSDEDLYESVALLVGEHAPAKETGMTYVAWMEKALRALYPEHQ
ncbi:hypothetical protein BGZ83_006738 [Gryganskiella cystojenkinii]|nr:hypothetical protein BGZ83_006738 [Gryganskiella cystojenkinii]